RKKARALEVKLSVTRIRRVLVLAVLAHAPLRRQHLAQALDQLVEDPSVTKAQYDEERGADGSADDVAHAGEAVEAVAQGAARGGDDDAGDDDDGAVPEGEEGADGGGALARGDEPPRHEVDGGDV